MKTLYISAELTINSQKNLGGSLPPSPLPKSGLRLASFAGYEAAPKHSQTHYEVVDEDCMTASCSFLVIFGEPGFIDLFLSGLLFPGN